MDSARTCVRNTQNLHLCESATHCGHHAESGQNPSWLGLGYREAKTQKRQSELRKLATVGVDRGCVTEISLPKYIP